MSRSYVSRHNARRQAVILGRVASPARYDSFYDLGYELVEARSLPAVTVPIGRLLFRWSDRDIEQSRRIPQAVARRWRSAIAAYGLQAPTATVH